jgi:hypothetical protein
MSIRTISISSCVLSLIICIVVSVFIFNIYKRFLNHTQHIVNIDQCDPEVYDQRRDEKKQYKQLLCMLHPLMVTDVKFRNGVLKKYNLPKAFRALKYLYNGTWTQDPAPDPYLKYMVMNPWYISDTKNNTTEFIFYSNDISSFTYNSKTFSNFNEDGLYLSFFKDDTNFVRWYIYIDISILMEIRKEIVEKSVEIKTADDLDRILLSKFYKFARDNIYHQQTCANNDPQQQEKNVKTCLFFNPDVPSKKITESFSGLVVALKRVIVVALSENVINEYIAKIDEKIRLGTNLRRIEFFMWLALKSHRDSITFKFKPMIK